MIYFLHVNRAQQCCFLAADPVGLFMRRVWITFRRTTTLWSRKKKVQDYNNQSWSMTCSITDKFSAEDGSEEVSRSNHDYTHSKWHNNINNNNNTIEKGKHLNLFVALGMSTMRPAAPTKLSRAVSVEHMRQ